MLVSDNACVSPRDYLWKYKPLGQFGVFFGTYQRGRIRELRIRLPIPRPGSNRGYQPEDLIGSFMCGVVKGSRRLTHIWSLLSDLVVIELFGRTSGMADQNAPLFLMIAYNLMAIFKQLVMFTAKGRMLSNIRFQCTAKGSYLVKRGSQKVMKLYVEVRRRHFLAHVFENLESPNPPFKFPNT